MVNLMGGTNKFRVLIRSDHFYPSIGGSVSVKMPRYEQVSNLIPRITLSEGEE